MVSLRRSLFIALAAAAFILASFVLARWLTGENRERGAVTDLIRAQALGDAASMAALIEDCEGDPACRARVAENVRRLRRPGDVQILRYDSRTARAVTERTGLTRVAWNTDRRDAAVVQCVEIERRGIPLLGGEVVLTGVGPQIDGEASCSQ